jgi:uncharacterized repeat protein (TIGR03806 family)
MMSRHSRLLHATVRVTPGSRLLAIALLVALVFVVGRAEAGVCVMGSRVPFAGHNMPAEGSPVAQGYKAVHAFPDLPTVNTWHSGLVAAPGDSELLFWLEQRGRIIVFDNDPAVDSADVFLDIVDQVHWEAFVTIETGLLGLAFDPEYESNRTFYVNYMPKPELCGEAITDPFCTKVVRYQTKAGNPREADPASAELILEFGQPAIEHNGGTLAFGPDGMLYISAGDGAFTGNHPDPTNRAQDTSLLNGSILRIDVRGEPPAGKSYGIPAGNPFGNEVFHYGLRNPWGFSFDREAPHDLWIGDVGEEGWEEIDYLPGGTPGGVNFGWDLCEGTHDVGTSDCADLANAEPPIIEYGHEGAGAAAIGGYVYRGSRLPELQGHYIFSDGSTGLIWGWDRVATEPGTELGAKVLLAEARRVGSIGEDQDGELYFVNWLQPEIFQLEPCVEGDSCFESPESVYPVKLSETGFFSDSEIPAPAPGMIEYAVNSPRWIDRAEKRRWIALPGSEKVRFDSAGSWSFPVGTAVVKHLELEVSEGTRRRLETRILFRQSDRWTGVTYRWDEDQKDATMLTGALVESIEVDIDGLTLQDWTYPSPNGCLECHNLASGAALGPRTRQLNGFFLYSGGVDNQLDAWNCIDLFDTDIGASERFDSYAPLDDGSASLLRRSRSYMSTNCAHCHRPGGGAPGGLDMRFDRLLGEMRLIGWSASHGDLGADEPERIKVGVKEESVVWLRQQSDDPQKRMAAGTLLAHGEAVDVFGQWIDTGLALIDSEEDGYADDADNCPEVANPGQENSDGDGLGDACDPDQLPDLVGQPSGPGAAAPGEVVHLAAGVVNVNDDGDTAPNSQATVHLSEDMILDPESDLLLLDCFVGELAGGAGKACARAGGSEIPDTPFGLPPGESADYHWIACADSLALVLEGDETNNCNSIPVTIPEPSLPLAQLLVLGFLAVTRRRA